MRYLYIIFFSITLNAHAQKSNMFDQEINKAISKYQYSQSSITEAAFNSLKSSIIKNRPLRRPDLLGLDAGSLVGYINTVHPPLDEVLKKYEELDTIWQIPFFESLLHTNKPFFQANKKVFHKLIRVALPDKFNGTVKEMLVLYTQENKPGIREFENLLKEREFLTFEQILLAELVVAEKENELGYELLKYFDKRKDTPEALVYLSFSELHTTKNKELNSRYKTFLKSKLLADPLDGYAWKAYSSFLPWFSRDEIVELCTLKKKDVSFKPDNYIARADYYQAAYFPVDNSMQLIEAATDIYRKLNLAFILSNTRDLTREQKIWLSDYFGKQAAHITGGTESLLVVLLERSLNPAISYNEIKLKYPGLYKAFHKASYLEDNFNAAKYSWRDAIRICNELNTFNKHIDEPDEYSKAEDMSVNDAFRLNNPTVLDMMFKKNRLLAELVDEYGDWPVDYGYIVDKAIQEVCAANHIEYSVFHNLKYLPGNDVEYTIYLKIGNTVSTVQFNNKTSYPNNEAIYLLLNKALMSAGIRQRFIQYNKEGYHLVFAEPDKYKEMMKRFSE